MSEVKLCKDCKWVRRDWAMAVISFGIVSPLAFAKCANPKSFGNRENTTSLVSGTTHSTCHCSTERKDFAALNTCGPKGIYWEPK